MHRLPYREIKGFIRNLSILVLFTGIFSRPSFGQQAPVSEKWSYGTSYTEPKGKWETGLFQPFRYGLSDKTELFVQALTLPLIPNAGVKIRRGECGGFMFSSAHEVSIPTPFLRFISRKGMGGLISPQFSFPFILAVTNSVIATKPIKTNLLFSAWARLSLAFRSAKPDPQSTIDLPLFYPRMASWYKGSTIVAGVSLRGGLCKKWYYEESLQGFLVTRSYDNAFVENHGTLMWASKPSFRLRGGYVLSYGQYPFGNHWQLWPSLDLVFGKK